MRPFLTALAAMIAACLLAACDAAERPFEPVVVHTAPSAPGTPKSISPVGEWRVVSLSGEPVPAGVTPPRLTIGPSGTTFGSDGINGCNGVLDRHSWDRGVFAYRPGLQTMIGGKSQQANEVASRYAVALREATTFTFRSGGLELHNAEGVVIMRFETATPEGAWRLASLRGEIVPAVARSQTLTIDAEGRIRGYSGVNSFWSEVDPAIWARGGFKFGQTIGTTLVGSQGEAMDRESRYLEALGEVTRFAVRSGALELSNDDDVIILSFEAERR